MYSQIPLSKFDRESLRPCPWCGGHANLYISLNHICNLYRVCCALCIAGGPVGANASQAKMRWGYDNED